MTPWEGVRYVAYRKIGKMTPCVVEMDEDEQTLEHVVRMIASGSWDDIVDVIGMECWPGSLHRGEWWDANEEIARAVWAHMLPLYDAVNNPWVPAFVMQHVPDIEAEIAGIDAEMAADMEDQVALAGSGWR